MRASDPLTLEFQAVVRCHVTAWTQTGVLYPMSRLSLQPLDRLSLSFHLIDEKSRLRNVRELDKGRS